MSSVIAIVGRPNVGKSTLFNILTGSKSAIVADSSGLTRDRQYGNVKNSSLVLIDTGGISLEESDMSEAIKSQTENAIQESDHIFFIVDAIDGLLPLDEVIADLLRKQNKRITLIINKVDNNKIDSYSSEFDKLGFSESLKVSSAHNIGFSELKTILNELEDSDEINESYSFTETLKISIIGRPNAGKSTLVNQLLGEDRVLVSPISGTTRDSIEVPYKSNSNEITLIDTAGMRRKRSIKDETEKFSVSKSVEAIKKANVVILLIDSSENIVDQDIHLLGLTLTIGRPVVIAANKLDILDKEKKIVLENNINRKIRFAQYLKPHFISAKKGTGVKKLLRKAEEAYNTSIKELDTSALNKILKDAVFNQQPSMSGRFRPKLRYVHAGGKNPPKIVIHGNNLKELKDSYTKYLENFFREKLNLGETPLSIRYKEQSNPFRNKPNKLTDRQIKKRKRIVKRRKK
jgi:GTP-binding protein|tara:strand:+ start:247 stop:1629 length:1383 start_codon:yes stop_codon:yes gene_type:complete